LKRDNADIYWANGPERDPSGLSAQVGYLP
jgi:hypothetical protein